jgi:hypothetical protein
MRLVASFTLVDHGITGLRGGPPLERAIVYALATGAGVLLLTGLWTPFAGALAAVIELCFAFSQPGDPLAHILVSNPGSSLGAGRAWRLVGRRAAFWVEAYQHSKPEQLALTPVRRYSLPQKALSGVAIESTRGLHPGLAASGTGCIIRQKNERPKARWTKE